MNEPETNQNMEQKCPQCGAPLPSGVLAGLCPACLLKQGAAFDTGVAPEAGSFQPPSLEEVVRLFPQLEILGLIGKGGMGAVYKARQPALDRLVAIKILPPQTAAGPGFVERFNREARALARLSHPNIVAVHEFGQVNGLSYFIMEFVDGVNLRELERAGKLSPREALQIVPQICEALQFAHDEGIVHRDIKPENILLDKKGRVKIADFGIAKILGAGSGPELTQTQSVVGTPHYMAPEQMEKPTLVDHRADIFSLGVVFYEMLTGELPLGKFAPPSSRKVEVDVRLDDVVLRTLERDPEMRYQHVSQVKSAVDTIVGTVAPPPRTPGVTGAALAQEILTKDYQLNIRSCVRRGWKLLKGEFWPFVGITALFMALFSFATTFGGASIMHQSEGNTTVEVVSAVAMLVFGPLWGGLCYYFLKKIRMEPATVETAFSGFSRDRFLHLFLAGFVMTMLTWLGFLLILPGIYFLVAWMFTLPIVMDKGIDFWSAMELSRKVVTKHWFKLLGLGLMLFLLLFCGALALGFGVFVAAPLILCTLMYAYEDIFGSATGVAPAPVAGATGPTGTVVMPLPVATTARSGPWTLPVKIGLAALALVLFVVILFPILRHHVRFDPEGALRAMHDTTQPEVTLVTPTLTGPVPDTDASAAAGMTTPASTTAPAAPAFGGEVEMELTNLTAVNLISGAQKSLPPYLAAQMAGDGKELAIMGWMEGADMDLAYVDGCGYSRLSGWARLERNIWDDATPDVVSAALQPAGKERGTKFEGAGENSSTNMTIGFQLRSGRLGLLQFMEISGDNPPTAKIRYKLFAAAGSAAGKKNPAFEQLVDRLEAAQGMMNFEGKNRVLAAIADDAAKLGDVAVVKRAISGMMNGDARSTAARDAAVELAKRGLRRPAIELAKTILDADMRDQTLSELAQ
jgi:predicted Ser/Thr protein kinase